jgi:hypothetical protein
MAGHLRFAPAASGGEALAPLCTPGRQHATAADRLHPLAEAVAALADELAGLIGTLAHEPALRSGKREWRASP